MTEKHIFADVDLPFHVWVKEGCRWVLRDAAQRARTDEASYREPPTSPAPSPEAPPRP